RAGRTVRRPAPCDGDEGRAGPVVRGDRGRAGHAGGDGQVPRASRPGAHAADSGPSGRGGLGVTEGFALPLDRAGIEAIIPHRDPFLLVDEVLELIPGERALGRYHVREDAWYLRGHFPGQPIMPGVLQVEALAQVGAVCGLSAPGFAGRLALFAGIDDVRFKRIVVPGDTLTLSCAITR